jgi:hypothetical protein
MQDQNFVMERYYKEREEVGSHATTGLPSLPALILGGSLSVRAMETQATTFRRLRERLRPPSADSASYDGSDDGKEPFYLDHEFGAVPRESSRPSTPHPDPLSGRDDTEGAAALLGSTFASSSLTVGSSRPPTPPGSPLTPIDESSRPHTPPPSPYLTAVNTDGTTRGIPTVSSLNNSHLSPQQTPESPGSRMALSPLSPHNTVVPITSRSPLQHTAETLAGSYAMSGPQAEPSFFDLTAANENSAYAPSSPPVRPGLRQRKGLMTQRVKDYIKSTVNSAT